MNPNCVFLHLFSTSVSMYFFCIFFSHLFHIFISCLFFAAFFCIFFCIFFLRLFFCVFFLRLFFASFFAHLSKVMTQMALPWSYRLATFVGRLKIISNVDLFNSIAWFIWYNLNESIEHYRNKTL